MKVNPCARILAILNAMLLCLSSVPVQGEQGKEDVFQSGGQASSEKSGRGQEKDNPQWSADPERGWVRADERHDGNDQGDSGKSNQSKAKQKGSGSKNKGNETSTK